MKNKFTLLFLSLFILLFAENIFAINPPILQYPGYKAVICTLDSVTFKWTNPDYTAERRIWVSDDPQFPVNKLLAEYKSPASAGPDSVKFSLKDLGLPATGKKYYWRVEVWCAQHTYNKLDWDFTNSNPSVIMGKKFEDDNGNGIQDSGEPFLPGWTINLSDGQSAVTDSNGSYSFSIADKGTYTISEVQQDGWTQTFPSSGTYSITITDYNTYFEAKDFGNKPPDSAVIKGKKFRDDNGNGIQDQGEPGLAGWTIYVSGIKWTETDKDGNYAFKMVPGTYYLYELGRQHWTQTCPAGYDYKNIKVNWGDIVEGKDFGNKPDPGIIKGIKFRDDNGNGVQDKGEPGIQGWVINLSDGQHTTTDQNGEFIFSVMMGSYTVTEETRYGWTQTCPQSGGYEVTLNPGDTVDNIIFGNKSGDCTFGGRKFRDDNGNGVQDEGEPGLPDWTIKLSDGQYTVTDKNGDYTFTVTAGTYDVNEVLQYGWTQTCPSDSGKGYLGVIVDPSKTMENLNFGNKPNAGTIKGKKFKDVNGDSVLNKDEPGLEGWTIKLSDGQTAVTDKYGEYSFTAAPGTYVVSEVNKAGWTQTYPKGGTHQVTVEPGDYKYDIDFGNKPIKCKIHGFKFRDDNGNGVYDENELKLAGWKINLSNGESEVTDSSGNYSFTVDWGTYTISESVQPGYTPTTPENGSKEISFSDSNDITVLFGNRADTIEVSGKKFRDDNGNGVQDDGEPGLQGWTIKLSNGQSAVTDKDGNFSIKVYPPGKYSLNEEVKTGWVQTCPAGGEGYKNIIVDPGYNLISFLFGNKPTSGSIMGKKFRDDNGNGTFDAGEPGLKGWTIKLNTGETTVTDANGNYSFSVAVGSYVVSEVQQKGWTQTCPKSGTYTVQVNAGETIEGRDFGNSFAGSLHGRKYFDINADSKPDSTEPGMNGVKIELYKDGVLYQSAFTDTADINGDGKIDPVSECGIFIFDNLPPGSYEVKEVVPKGFFQTQPPGGSYKVTLPSEVSIPIFLFGNATDMYFDFGDLPDPTYPTKLPGGACHLDQGPMLGKFRDAEMNGQPDLLATGDDFDGLPVGVVNNDEDGVKFVSFMPGSSGQVAVEITGAKSDFPCQLAAWIDFNGDGVLNFSELVIFKQINAAGIDTIKFNVPATIQGIAYARFRLSTSALSVLFPFGPALDGEVEDYVAWGFDYGDAPELFDPDHPEFPYGYPTKLIHNGARHIATSTTKLGSTLTDVDNDGQPNCFADGDNRNNRKDEDGILFETGFSFEDNVPDPADNSRTYSYYKVKRNSKVTFKPLASVTGLFNAWFDFNRDGKWDDSTEHVFVDERVNPGPDYTELTFTIPGDASAGYTYARFRFSTQANLKCTGPAMNGEVEDYLMYVDTVITSVGDNQNSAVPSEFKLYQNYPNPFNPTTLIKYQLPVSGYVVIKIYNMLGKEITTLVNGRKQSGYHEVEWNAEQLPSGVYFYSIYATADAPAENGVKEFRAVKKMILIK